MKQCQNWNPLFKISPLTFLIRENWSKLRRTAGEKKKLFSNFFIVQINISCVQCIGEGRGGWERIVPLLISILSFVDVNGFKNPWR